MADKNANPTQTIVGGAHWCFFAPKGTPLPTTVGSTPGASLDGAFVGLGYTDNDGSSFAVETSTTDLFASQSLDPLRTIVQSAKASFTAPLIQWSADTLVAAFGGGSVTSGGGVHTYEPPAAGTLDDGVLVVDIVDGGTITRLVFERALPVGSITAGLNKTSWGSLPVTWTALAPENADTAWFLITNSSAFGS